MSKYWDIIVGVITGLTLAVLAKFDSERIQLINSIIILILVSIGVFKIIKQSIDKNKTKRKEALIDAIVNSQRPVKALNLALNPMKEGEKLGTKLIKLWEEVKYIMNKIKTFLDKFKGFILTAALSILTVVEMCGGHLNELVGGALTINGVELLPIITLGAAVVVGCISNGWSKDQAEKIKALFSKSSTNELVVAEIKKTVKENDAKLKEYKKLLAVKETELENCETMLKNAKNTYAAKKEMYNMVPQLATADDVQLAANNAVDCEAKVNDKKAEIEKLQETINRLTTTNNALRSQL